MNRLMGLVIGTWAVLAGLAGPRAAEKMPESSWYPLRAGTTWHYKTEGGQFHIRVAKHEKVGGVLCARLEATRDGKIVSVEHVRVTADGVYRQDIQGPSSDKPDQPDKLAPVETLNPPLCLFRLPIQNNTSWKIQSTSDGKIYQGMLKSSQEEVTVPAGSYKAVRVTGQDFEAGGVKLTISNYYAENVGLVKQVLETGGGKITIELEKFEVGK